MHNVVLRRRIAKRLDDGVRLYYRREYDAALETLEQAFLDLPQAKGDPHAGVLAARLLRLIGIVRKRIGEAELARELFDASLAVAVGAGAEMEAADVLLDLAVLDAAAAA